MDEWAGCLPFVLHLVWHLFPGALSAACTVSSPHCSPVLVHRLQNTSLAEFALLDKRPCDGNCSAPWQSPPLRPEPSEIDCIWQWRVLIFHDLPKHFCTGKVGEKSATNQSRRARGGCGCLFVPGDVFFWQTISKKHKTASSVPAFHRRHNKVQNDVSYWSEWALMGLPESTSKTHREKKHLKNFFPWCFSCSLACPVPISQNPACPVWGGCCDTAGEHQPWFRSVIAVELQPRMGFAQGYKDSFYISTALTSQNSQQFVGRVWSLLTQSLDCIISSINLSASIIKPLGHRVAAQLFHNLNPLVAAMPVFFPAYMY